MRKLTKTRIVLALLALPLVIVVVAISVSTWNCTIAWFVWQPGFAVSVNGSPARGYSHVLLYHPDSKNPDRFTDGRLITLWHSDRRETFWISHGRGATTPTYCADWIAPRLPAFDVITYEPSVCVNVIPDGQTEIPGYIESTLMSAREGFIEFRTSDGRNVKATW